MKRLLCLFLFVCGPTVCCMRDKRVEEMKRSLCSIYFLCGTEVCCMIDRDQKTLKEISESGGLYAKFIKLETRDSILRDVIRAKEDELRKLKMENKVMQNIFKLNGDFLEALDNFDGNLDKFFSYEEKFRKLEERKESSSEGLLTNVLFKKKESKKALIENYIVVLRQFETSKKYYQEVRQKFQKNKCFSEIISEGFKLKEKVLSRYKKSMKLLSQND